MAQLNKPAPGLTWAEADALDKNISYSDFLTLCPRYNIFADQEVNSHLPRHILTRLCWREMKRGKNYMLNPGTEQPPPSWRRGYYQILTLENRLQGYGAINFKGSHTINLLLFNNYGFPSSVTLGFSNIATIIYRFPSSYKKRLKNE